ncbi:hypothetical protein FHP24_27260 [Aliirhizobium smilacinae]|uniref:Uncharacterized protein n=1 Tax=Aliirhizobium smilacinae TaxID=1395944 RepID=A0A5C4X8U1_9HYPH|nr:hypothetical protein FHP24_27260 [Rhizobium smilacinae]
MGAIDYAEMLTSHWRHYLAVVQRKPGALQGAPFAELPDAFRTVQQYSIVCGKRDRSHKHICHIDADRARGGSPLFQ